LSRASTWILCGILFVALALRLYTFRGYFGLDDGEYARLANAMVEGNLSAFIDENYIRNFYAPAHLRFRLALIAPLAFLFRLFGISEWVLVSYPLFVSFLGIVLAFLCGRFMFGVTAGLIAAALWAVIPVDVTLAAQFLPDAIASFYASAGVLVLLCARASVATQTSNGLLGGLAAGLLFGLSWLSKESIVYLVPLCGLLLILDFRADFRKAWRLWAGVAAASGGILLAEMIAYGVLSGDFLLRMHENERSFGQTKSYLFYEGSRFGWPVGGSHAKALLKRLFLDGPSAIFLNPQFLYLPLLGLLAAAYGGYWKDRAFLIPALWMITLVLAYDLASCSFSTYTPLVLLNRYLHPILLPASVLTAGLIVKLLANRLAVAAPNDTRERFFWGSVITLVLCSVAAYSAFRAVRDIHSTRAIFSIRHIANLVKPSATIYTDPLTAKALEFFWRYPARTDLVNFEGMRAEDVRPGSFIFVDRYRLDWLKVNVSMWLTKDYGYHAPEFAGRIPNSWTIVWQNENGVLYRSKP
jgi:4-amino-4-deoxy-L-arabinose transferase-like glycosyltransferase